MDFLEDVADCSDGDRRVLFAREVVLSEGVVQQGDRIIDQLFGRQLQIEPIVTQNIFFEENKVEDKVEWRGNVHPEIVQAENVALQVEQHLRVEPVLEKFFDVFDREYHLLVELYRYFKGHRIDNAHKSWLA